MEDTTILYSVEGEAQAGLITLNRESVRNALNTTMAQRLLATLDQCAADPVVRTVIITGAGDKAFCAGGDFKERAEMSVSAWTTQHRVFETLHHRLRQFPKPLIAAVNGLALGGGFEMALSCDWIIAENCARFGFPEVTRGIIPGVGGTQLVGKFLPQGRALYLLLTGQTVAAEQAYKWGMVHQVVDGPVLPLCLTMAGQIAKNSPFAVQMAKRAFKLGNDLPIELGAEVALESYYRTVAHPDREEGVNAFNEKRDPVYRPL